MFLNMINWTPIFIVGGFLLGITATLLIINIAFKRSRRLKKENKELLEKYKDARSGDILFEVLTHDFLFGIQVWKLYVEFMGMGYNLGDFQKAFYKHAGELIHECQKWDEAEILFRKFPDFSKDDETHAMIATVLYRNSQHIIKLYEREVERISELLIPQKVKDNQCSVITSTRNILARYNLELRSIEELTTQTVSLV